MKTIIALLALTAFVALYVVWLRPWLRSQPWAEGFFQRIEPLEIMLYRKSESLLWSRFLVFLGAFVPFLQFVGAFDITPFMAFIPYEYQPYLMAAVAVCGFIGEQLRKDTTKPLEVVELPTHVPVEVAVAVQKAEDANATAVAVVAAEKEEIKVAANQTTE